MKKALKWVGIILGSLVGLILLFIGVIYIWSEIKLNKNYEVKSEMVRIPTDEASIEEGARLFVSRGCADCHGSKGEGMVFLQDGAVGTFAGTNLTRGKGGIGKEYSDADYVRAIRYGVRKDGKALIFMPSDEFFYYNDQELGNLIAYIKSIPPVNNVPPKTSVGPVFRALDIFGVNPINPGVVNINKKHVNVECAPTPEYGKVLAQGCTGCHGDNFSGGPIPGAPSTLPIATNITPNKKDGIGNWTYEDFDRALRHGVRPNGGRINEFMPWKNLSKLNDIEVQAIWTYLRTVPPKDFGNR